jgi:hypothetical protein
MVDHIVYDGPAREPELRVQRMQQWQGTGEAGTYAARSHGCG